MYLTCIDIQCVIAHLYLCPRLHLAATEATILRVNIKFLVLLLLTCYMGHGNTQAHHCNHGEEEHRLSRGVRVASCSLVVMCVL